MGNSGGHFSVCMKNKTFLHDCIQSALKLTVLFIYFLCITVIKLELCFSKTKYSTLWHILVLPITCAIKNVYILKLQSIAFVIYFVFIKLPTDAVL